MSLYALGFPHLTLSDFAFGHIRLKGRVFYLECEIDHFTPLSISPLLNPTSPCLTYVEGRLLLPHAFSSLLPFSASSPLLKSKLLLLQKYRLRHPCSLHNRHPMAPLMLAGSPQFPRAGKPPPPASSSSSPAFLPHRLSLHLHN